jgi:tight adherence protein C
VFAAIDFMTILPFAIFGAFAAGVWWLLDAFSSKKGRAEERLDDFRDPNSRKRRGEESGGSTMSSILERASPALAKPLQPKTQAETDKLKLKLGYAGFRHESAPNIYLTLKCIGLITGGLLSGGTLLFVTGFNIQGLFKAAMAGALFFYLPDVLLWFLGKKRKEAIFLALPDTLDLLVVCVEAGLGLDQAMRKVAEEMKKTYRVLSDELSLCNFQLQMGRARTEVLHDLGERTGAEDLQALASILIQADKFGSSVAQALRVQSDAMRVKRSQMAEEKAAKTAVKLIFPLVLFIFPGIFVVLVGPAGITMVREMFPAMSGGG